MSERTNIYLKELATGQPVEAILIDGVNMREVSRAEISWKPHIDAKEKQLRQNKVPRENWPQHLHWDWTRKHKKTARLLAYHWLGIECEEEMQGLMLLDTASGRGRILEQSGKPLIYIHYLATAPWNAAELTDTPKYGWIGRVFIAAAIQISIAEDFKGRLALHSLPQAESFYSRTCGMLELGADSLMNDLVYFEMTTEQAAKFLQVPA